MLDTELFTIGNTTITVATSLTSILIIVLSFWISNITRKLLKNILIKSRFGNEKSQGPTLAIINYLILFLGFAVAIQTLGVDLSALFAAGAIFAVGIGFAMQSIAENFVAGIVLLLERSIRPLDILEVEGNIVKVVKMGIRATIVRTWDGEELIVPNSILVRTTVKNFTLHDSHYRLKTKVGVVYSSNLQEVFSTLREIAQSLEWRLQDLDPQIFLSQFGDNAVVFEVAVWIVNPWEKVPRQSMLNEAVWGALAKKGIVIAFPQLDLHLDEASLHALNRLVSSDG